MAHKGMRWLRHKLAARVEANGGYTYRYDEGSALSWDVGVHGSVGPDHDSFMAAIGDHFQNEADLFIRFPNWRARWERYARQDDFFTDLIDEMRESWTGSDTCQMWSPEVARRYGFSYSRLGERVYRYRCRKEGRKPLLRKGAEKPFDAKWEFMGRGGKHLCLMEFEGRKIPVRGFAEELLDRHEDHGFTNRWCRKLLGMLDEWEPMLEQVSVMQEANYQAGWRFFSILSEETGDDGDLQQLAA